MSNCTKAAQEDIKRWIAEDAAKEMANHGVTPEVAKEVLKMIEGSDLDDKDGVHIRVITVKREKNSKEDSKEEAAEEAKPEATEEPESEDKLEGLADLLQSNTRFYKFAKNMTREYCRVSQLVTDILKENVELRARLNEKS